MFRLLFNWHFFPINCLQADQANDEINVESKGEPSVMDVPSHNAGDSSKQVIDQLPKIEEIGTIILFSTGNCFMVWQQQYLNEPNFVLIFIILLLFAPETSLFNPFPFLFTCKKHMIYKLFVVLLFYAAPEEISAAACDNDTNRLELVQLYNEV